MRSGHALYPRHLPAAPRPESQEDSLRVTDDVVWLQAQSDAVRNTLFAGVIQNFEFVYGWA
jgi:hypothetical protein